MKWKVFFLLLTLAIYASNLYAKEATQAGKTVGEKNLLQSRIDFGNAYISGQSLKSGALYLLQRKSSEIKSMLEYRKDYREEILENFSIRQKDEIPF